MYQKDDYVVYKRNVCKIKEIKENEITKTKSYVLVPIDDDSLTIEISLDNASANINPILQKKDALKIIDKISDIGIIKDIPEKMFEHEYKRLLSTGNHEDLISIIKTTYLRNQKRLSDRKKIGEKDNNYFNLAEKKLYNEFSISLGMSYDETKDFIADKVNNNDSN